jgi:hypothetical protein
LETGALNFVLNLLFLFLGTYSDLLIESHNVEVDGGTGTVPKIENKRRRRKRKDMLHKSSSSANLSSRIGGRRVSEYLPSLGDFGRSGSESVPTRRASSSELGKWWKFSDGAGFEDSSGLVHQQSVREPPVAKHSGYHNINQGQEDMPVTLNGFSCASSASGKKSPEEKAEIDLPQGADLKEGGVNIRTKGQLGENASILHQGNGAIKSVGLSPKVQHLSSPFFMKTVMSARSSRTGNSVEPSLQARLKSDNWEWYSSRRAASMTSDKSSQGPLSPFVSSAVLHNGSGHSGNGHAKSEDLDRTREAGGSQDVGVSQRNNVKKVSGSSGLKKMVKKLF